MSVDLSPDGRWLVFDLLGHIYRLPSSGGAAELCDLIRHHEAPAPAGWAGTPQQRRHAALRAVDAAC